MKDTLKPSYKLMLHITISVYAEMYRNSLYRYVHIECEDGKIKVTSICQN